MGPRDDALNDIIDDGTERWMGGIDMNNIIVIRSVSSWAWHGARRGRYHVRVRGGVRTFFIFVLFFAKNLLLLLL